jgi:acyl-CoA thioesterase I
MSARPALRIAFLGDSMVNGTGDDACLGWVGRACAAARRGGRDVTAYNLGIRRDTSADVRGRWRREAEARLPEGHDGRLVFSFGANDCCLGEDGAVRVAHGAAVAHAEAILAEALGWKPVLMVGPVPVVDSATAGRVAALDAAYAALCAGLGVPYLSVAALVAASGVWRREVAAGDGAHPNEGGYALLAECVMRWEPWRRWIGAAGG